jgi:predicted lipoprotein with Yx(FWY)xxD motif
LYVIRSRRLEMVKVANVRGGALLLATAVAALLAAFLVIRPALAGTDARMPLVRAQKNTTLHETVLVNRRGLTLYSLSAERRGRFICTTSACLAFWKPLVVAKGTKPSGAARLGTIRRRDGRMQVTYRGGPLYSFYLDRKPGDAKGEGFKDVGVWHAASLSKTKPATMPPTSPYGGAYP